MLEEELEKQREDFFQVPPPILRGQIAKVNSRTNRKSLFEDKSQKSIPRIYRGMDAKNGRRIPDRDISPEN